MTKKVILHTHSGATPVVEVTPEWRMNDLQIAIATKKAFNKAGMKDRVLWAEVVK